MDEPKPFQTRFPRHDKPIFKRKKRRLPAYPCDFDMACTILYYIKELGWSQAKVAKVLRQHTSTVSRIMSGERFKGAVPRPPKDPL